MIREKKLYIAVKLCIMTRVIGNQNFSSGNVKWQ